MGRIDAETKTKLPYCSASEQASLVLLVRAAVVVTALRHNPRQPKEDLRDFFERPHISSKTIASVLVFAPRACSPATKLLATAW